MRPMQTRGNPLLVPVMGRVRRAAILVCLAFSLTSACGDGDVEVGGSLQIGSGGLPLELVDWQYRPDGVREHGRRLVMHFEAGEGRDAWEIMVDLSMVVLDQDRTASGLGAARDLELSPPMQIDEAEAGTDPTVIIRLTRPGTEMATTIFPEPPGTSEDPDRLVFGRVSPLSNTSTACLHFEFELTSSNILGLVCGLPYGR